MKMKKQLFIAMLAYFLVFQTILAPISGTIAFAIGEDEEVKVEEREALDSKETEKTEAVKDIIKNVYFTDKDNKEVDVDKHEGEIITHVDWSAQNKENLPGYKEEFLIPEQIQLKEDSGDLEAEEVKVATYKSVGTGKTEIEFNEDLEALKEIEGTFTFKGEIEVDEEEEVIEEAETKEEKKSAKAENKIDESDKVKEEKSTDNKEANKKIEIQADRAPEKITETIIDNIRLKYKDGSEFEDGDLINVDEDLRFELDWSLPNDKDFVAGDYFEFQLPNQITVYSEIKNGDLGGYGTIDVDLNGKVKFTFNERVEQESDIKGTFWFDTKLDKEVVKSTNENLEIIFDDGVKKNISINVKPTGGQAISKKGEPVDGNFNTEEVKWTVIVNTTRDSLKNAVIDDTILAGQELILDSLVLTEVEVDLAGKVTKELDEVTGFEDNSNPGKLNIVLGDTNKAYKLTFKTKLLEANFKEGTTKYENTAYLKSDGKDDAQAGGSVSVSRPKSVEKTSTAFDKEDRSIEWKVNANFTEQNLKQGEVITDEFTFTVDGKKLNDIFEIKKANIEILQVDKFDKNGKPAETSNAKDLFDISVEGNKVTYKLKNASNKAFILKYKTELKDGAYINKDGKITNKIDLNGKTATGSQGVVQQVGKKTNAGINYKDKTIAWTITVNADKQDLRNFVLTDSFAGTGQKLVKDSIKITPAGSSATITPNADNEGFKINFGDITEKYTITYKTKFTYDFEGTKSPNFKNGVKITYDTKDESGYELGFGNEVKPNKETMSNGAKNGSANNETKEITWKIDINYNELTLDNAKVTDAIPDNQSLIDGSVKVYETSIADKGGITVGNDVTNQFTVDASDNKVNVDFDGTIDKSYRIEFKTKDKDGIYNRDEVYENTAQFIPRNGEKHNLTANVTLPKQGEFLGKKGFHNKEAWTADWTIDVNESKSKLTDVTVKDDLGSTDLQILLEDTIVVTKKGSDKTLIEGTDYKLSVDGNTLSIDFPGVITDHYIVTYSSYIVAEDDAAIKNDVEIKSVKEIIVGSTESFHVIDVKISTGGGTGEGTTGGLILNKFEADSKRALKDVAFSLVKTIGNKEIVVREGITDETGKLEWKGLKYGDYTLKEVVPKGYLGNEEQTVTLSSKDPKGVKILEVENEREKGTAKIIKVDSSTDELLKGAKFTLKNQTTKQEYTFETDKDGVILEKIPFGEYSVKEITAPKGYRITKDIPNITVEIDKTAKIEVENVAFVDVAGQKTWYVDKNKELPKEITVELLANGKKIDDQTVTKKNNWKYSFKNLDKYNKADKEIKYEINEVEVDGYTTKQDGFDLTNIQNTHVTGTKAWVDDNNPDRPDQITVQLLADGKKLDKKTAQVTKESNWTYGFYDLPKYDTEGSEITYTVDELKVDGYKAVIDGFDITNTRENTTSVKGEKTWKDENPTDRPKEIKVDLTREVKGEADKDFSMTQTVKPNNQGKWVYEFDKLDEFNKNGVAYTYIIKEDNVPKNYISSVNGYDITNVRVGETEVSGTKRWKDDKVEDRPGTIKVNLLRNNVVVESTDVTADDNWKYNFTKLAKYDEDGKYYNYTVKEEHVPGYAPKVTGKDITNTRSEKTNIEITKGWLDDNSKDRPGKVIVYLYQNDKLFDTLEVTSKKKWILEVPNLEAYDEDGQPYSYTIKEKALPGYETKINGFNITNLRVGETEVSGTKTWKDNNDATKDRPESITVELLQNGEPTGKTEEVIADKDGNWKYSFKELDKYDDKGKAYKYEIKEQNVEGYKSVVDKSNNLTNIRTGKIDVSGTKTWKDNDDATKDRPESIKVQLLQNGTAIGETQIVKAEKNGDWKYSFTDLDQFDENGAEWGYTVDEKRVIGYKKSTEGHNLINTRVGKTEVNGEKIWKDNNNATGDRPDEITVNLLQNGKVFAVEDTDVNKNWSYSFENLPRFDENGVEWGYTVDEEPVKGYEKSVKGNDLINTRVGETKVSGEKIWKDNNNSTGDRPDEITVNLLQNGQIFAVEDTDINKNWSYNFENLPRFDENGVEWGYTVDEEPVKGYEKSVDNHNLINTRVGKTEVNGEKIWLDDDNATGNRPDEITVILLQNGEEFTRIPVNKTDDYKYSFKHLPRFDENGAEWGYTVDEVDVDGYKKSAGEGDDLVNTRIGKTEVTVDKFWKDEDKSDRPESITVNLLQNGTVFTTEKIKADEEDNWSHTFKELPEFDEQGKAYEYTVTEQDVPGYDSSVDGFEITNTRADEKSINITKAWLDNNSKDRPESIEVELFRSIAKGDKESVETYTVTAESDWHLEINALPAFDPNGKAYTYEIEEEAVKNYESEINGFDITNLRVSDTQVSGTKVWKGDKETNRPDEITVKLFANKEEVDSQNVTAKSDWKYAFTDLPKYDEQGKEINYTVNEVAVKGYETKVDGYDITNTFIPVDPTEPKPEDPGKPVKPGEPSEPGKPSEPGDSGKPGEPSEPGKPSEPGDSSKSGESVKPGEDKKPGKGLPSTASNMYNLVIIGLLMLVVGAILYIVRRKRAN